jgi:predicted permease
MDALVHDLRYALRLLRKSPVFTVVAVLVIMLGTGAVTTIFSVVDALLLRPPSGVRAPGALVDVTRTDGDGRGFHVFSYPAYREMRDRSRTLDGLAAWANEWLHVGLSRNAERESVMGNIVSGNYFAVLGIEPQLGRFFLPEEDRTPLTHPVAVVSDRFWRERLGGDRSAIGRTIEINRTPFTIVGVAPPEFAGTVAVIRADLWVPIMMAPAMRHNMGDLAMTAKSSWLQAFGRVRDGGTPGAARAELTQIAKSVEAELGGKASEVGVRVSPLRPLPPQMETPVALFMAVLMSVATLVLLIAAVNVAGMMLARASARRREIVVRLSLGASRARLVRQLLVESVLLFVGGGAAGVLLTVWCTRLIESIRPIVDFPLRFHLPIDLRVMAFTLAVSLATGIVFGLVPALKASKRDLATALRADTAGSGQRQRTRSAFVVGQLAMSVLLVVAAGLFLRALQRGRVTDPGYRIDHVLTMSLDLENEGYDSTQVREFRRQLAERVAALPGVEAVSFTSLIPLQGNQMATGITVPGHQAPRGRDFISIAFESVGRDYFRVMRLDLLRGRAFDARDTKDAPRVAVVTEAFARRFWPADDAVGKTFASDGATYTIVGVARDGRFHSIAESPEPMMFLLDEQSLSMRTNLVARTAGDPEALGPSVERIVKVLDARMAVPTPQSLERAASIGLFPQRVAAMVTGILGGIGLLLAAVGLYGLVAFTVAQRTREIGVRIALGATPRGVVRLVVGQGVRLAGVGLAIGLALAMVGSRALAPFLFGVSALDPIALLGVPVVLGPVAIAASWVPARRASRVDAAVALRAE